MPSIQSFNYISLGSGQPVSLNFGNPPTTSGFTFALLLRINSASAAVTSVTDTYGNTWVQAPGAAQQSANGSFDCWYVYPSAAAILSGGVYQSLVITVNYSGSSSFVSAGLYVLSGAPNFVQGVAAGSSNGSISSSQSALFMAVSTTGVSFPGWATDGDSGLLAEWLHILGTGPQTVTAHSSAVAFSGSGGGGGLGITTASLPTAHIGAAYSATLSASGGTGPYTFSIVSGSLPNGLSLNSSTGVISGTPAYNGGGNFSLTVQVADSMGATASKTFTLDSTALVGGSWDFYNDEILHPKPASHVLPKWLPVKGF